MCVFCLGLEQTQKKLFNNLIQTLSKIGKINFFLFYLRCNKIGAWEGRKGRQGRSSNSRLFSWENWYRNSVKIQFIIVLPDIFTCRYDLWFQIELLNTTFYEQSIWSQHSFCKSKMRPAWRRLGGIYHCISDLA